VTANYSIKGNQNRADFAPLISGVSHQLGESSLNTSEPKLTPAPTPAAAPVPVPTQSSRWSRADVIASLAAAIAVVSVIFSFCIARNADLDATRGALRAQALSFIDFNQAMLNNYNCYFVALPDATNLKRNSDEAKELQDQLDNARKGLAKLDDWGNTDLKYFRNKLDTLPGNAAGTKTQLVGQLRAGLSPSQLTRADQVCAFGG